MMAIIRSCCFGIYTVRDGSFACALYTLTSYTIFVTIGAFHVNLVINIPVLFMLSVFLLLFFGLCVMASVVLLVGLCVDNRKMLIPWMLAVSMTTALDLLLCCFLINDKETIFDSMIWILLLSDISICFLNIYCVLCVYSQYQEYLEGRGGPEGDQRRRNGNEFVIISPNFLCLPKNSQQFNDNGFDSTRSTDQTNTTYLNDNKNDNYSQTDFSLTSDNLYNTQMKPFSKTFPQLDTNSYNYDSKKQFNAKLN